MANRLRSKAVQFMLSPEEHELFKRKLDELHITDISAFLRRLVFKGHYIKLDLSGLTEVSRLASINANNINQIARRLNEGGGVYAAELRDIQGRQQSIERTLVTLLNTLDEIERVHPAPADPAPANLG